jgi:HEAT repeat protein
LALDPSAVSAASVVMPALVSYIQKDPKDFSRAVLFLEALQPPPDILFPLLLSSLRSRDLSTRTEASNILGDQILLALPSMMAFFANEKDRKARRRIVEVFYRELFGEETVSAWLACLVAKEKAVRHGAVLVLGEIPKDALTELSEFLLTLDVDRSPAVAALISCLAVDVLELRRSAVLGLALLGKGFDSAVAALISRLTDEAFEVRGDAAYALGFLCEGAESAVPALIAALTDNIVEVRHAAADALGLFGEDAAPAVPALLTCLDAHNPLQSTVVAVLGKIGAHADAISPLREALLQERFPSTSGIEDVLRKIRRAM